MAIHDNIPYNYNQAMNSSDANEWKEAIQKEIESLNQNNTWSIVNKNEINTSLVGSRWVFAIKYDSTGKIERYKARLVAKGYTQEYGINYFDNYSPVARMDTMRVMMGIAANQYLLIEQMDVNTAFLYGELKEEIYLRLPDGFPAEQRYCKLHKSIYGLKQASRVWNQNFDSYVKEIGFNNTEADPCLYVLNKNKGIIYLLLYVDDIILFTKTEKEMNMIKNLLKQKYNMKELGKLEWYLGIQVTQDDQSIKLNQQLYIKNILKKFNMENCKTVNTPMEGNLKLTNDMRPTTNQEKEEIKNIPYRSAIGSLNYLSTCTRPDISFAVSEVAKFNENPGIEHWKAVKRIMRYLKGTINQELIYKRSDSIELTGFADADWAGDNETRKSTTGYIFKINGIVTWKSVKQSCIALSTVEAEYVSLGECSKEALWLIKLLKQIGYEVNLPIIIYEDNQGAIKLAENPVFHKRTKHIDTRMHFIRKLIEDNIIKIKYCESKKMVADIFTKALHFPAFNSIKKLMFN